MMIATEIQAPIGQKAVLIQAHDINHKSMFHIILLALVEEADITYKGIKVKNDY